MAQLPHRQSVFTRFALRHPVLVALASGLVIASWTAIVVGDPRAELAAGAGSALLVWLLWTRWGWARRRETRLFDPDGRRRQSH